MKRWQMTDMHNALSIAQQNGNTRQYAEPSIVERLSFEKGRNKSKGFLATAPPLQRLIFNILEFINKKPGSNVRCFPV